MYFENSEYLNENYNDSDIAFLPPNFPTSPVWLLIIVIINVFMSVRMKRISRHDVSNLPFASYNTSNGKRLKNS